MDRDPESGFGVDVADRAEGLDGVSVAGALEDVLRLKIGVQYVRSGGGFQQCIEHFLGLPEAVLGSEAPHVVGM
ncbi:hypothetical protein [Nocardia sp. NPDC046763]|uniref:hypothetical protein n=1 Tax=Nocardia sp. NPDC046763 TaxID=3155256 RepID=UPI0033F6915C